MECRQQRCLHRRQSNAQPAWPTSTMSSQPCPMAMTQCAAFSVVIPSAFRQQETEGRDASDAMCAIKGMRALRIMHFWLARLAD